LNIDANGRDCGIGTGQPVASAVIDLGDLPRKRRTDGDYSVSRRVEEICGGRGARRALLHLAAGSVEFVEFAVQDAHGAAFARSAATMLVYLSAGGGREFQRSDACPAGGECH